MTTKSIQQRAEGWCISKAGHYSYSYFQGYAQPETKFAHPSSVEAYTAGATDERRELGKIILEMAQSLESVFELWQFEGKHWAKKPIPLTDHAELIARLRGELK
jgi:hypothetical protein